LIDDQIITGNIAIDQLLEELGPMQEPYWSHCFAMHIVMPERWVQYVAYKLSISAGRGLFKSFTPCAHRHHKCSVSLKDIPRF